MPYTDYAWITDRLAIGAFVTEPEDLPFDAILSMETQAPAGLRDLVRSDDVEYHWQSILDGNTWERHGEIVARFDAAAAQLDAWIAAGKRVLVHCFMGISRSVTAVIWYLMRYQGLNWDQALALVHRTRPIARPNIRFEITLRLASGEDLSQEWIEDRIAAYCRQELEEYDLVLKPEKVRRDLVRQGTLHGDPAA